MTFDECNDAYRDADAVLKQGIQARTIRFQELADFNDASKRFVRTVKHGTMHEDWDAAAKFFRIVHARLARTPCRPSWLIKHLCKNWRGDQVLQKIEQRIGSVDPSLRENCEELVHGLERMSRIDKNPLLDEILVTLSNPSRDGQKYLFVLREFGLLEEFQNCLRSFPDNIRYEIVRPSNLREIQRADRIYLFGPPWLLTHKKEEYLVRSPAAPEIFIVGCDHEFSGEILLSGLDEKPQISFAGRNITTASDDPFFFETLSFSPESRFLFKKSVESPLWESGRLVEAISFRFGNNSGTYFKTDSKVWSVLYGNAGGVPRCLDVEKVEAEELEQNHLILMKTHGGGDMIPSVADAILPRAKEIRRLQTVWKEALTREIKQHGISDVVERLQRCGASLASEINVRNWVNPRRLGMENLESDLKAVLILIRMESKYEMIKEGIQRLRSAHQSAGSQLQIRLRESVKGMDIRKVFSDGFMEVKLGDGPGISIYLVEERGNVEEIPEEWEGELQEIDD